MDERHAAARAQAQAHARTRRILPALTGDHWLAGSHRSPGELRGCVCAAVCRHRTGARRPRLPLAAPAFQRPGESPGPRPPRPIGWRAPPAPVRPCHRSPRCRFLLALCSALPASKAARAEIIASLPLSLYLSTGAGVMDGHVATGPPSPPPPQSHPRRLQPFWRRQSAAAAPPFIFSSTPARRARPALPAFSSCLACLWFLRSWSVSRLSLCSLRRPSQPAALCTRSL